MVTKGTATKVGIAAIATGVGMSVAREVLNSAPTIPAKLSIQDIVTVGGKTFEVVGFAKAGEVWVASVNPATGLASPVTSVGITQGQSVVFEGVRIGLQGVSSFLFGGQSGPNTIYQAQLKLQNTQASPELILLGGAAVILMGLGTMVIAFASKDRISQFAIRIEQKLSHVKSRTMGLLRMNATQPVENTGAD